MHSRTWSWREVSWFVVIVHLSGTVPPTARTGVRHHRTRRVEKFQTFVRFGLDPNGCSCLAEGRTGVPAPARCGKARKMSHPSGSVTAWLRSSPHEPLSPSPTMRTRPSARPSCVSSRAAARPPRRSGRASGNGRSGYSSRSGSRWHSSSARPWCSPSSMRRRSHWSGPAPPGRRPHRGPVIVVQSGDTLTSIARRLQPSGDVSGLVDRLAALHGPGALQPGDRIALGSLSPRG